VLVGEGVCAALSVPVELDGGVIGTLDISAGQLQAALAHRWLIEQAQGVLMGRERLDAQTAFERLRGAARSSTRRLAEVPGR
jgi:AmiR/NasT family two-component response regulator